MSANGEVVIDRLDTLRRSLERALAGVHRELVHRKCDESYKDTYLSGISRLVAEGAQLEDHITKELNYA
jgi:phosphatidate phosphatase PAH1